MYFSIPVADKLDSSKGIEILQLKQRIKGKTYFRKRVEKIKGDSHRPAAKGIK